MFFFKQKTAYVMRISDWSSDVCSSDLMNQAMHHGRREKEAAARPVGDQVECLGRVEAAGLRDYLVGAACHMGQAVEAGAVADRRAVDDAEIGRASCRERV